MPGARRVEFGQAAPCSAGLKWTALHESAAVVAMLADHTAESLSPQQRNFPAIMRDVGGWRGSLAEQGVEDLVAIMEAGLAALLALHARGGNPAAAALALWQEFHGARAALFDLIPPSAPQRLG